MSTLDRSRWFSRHRRGRLPLATIFSAYLAIASGHIALAKPGLSEGDLHAHEAPAQSRESHESHAAEAHEHKALEISPGQPVPTVRLVVHPDAMRGWNLEVNVTNFRFAPERVNTKSLVTEGHAHLYVDGKKVTRLYGSWYYLDGLPPGRHTITVALNANGHEQLMANGKPIAATAIVEVPAEH